MSIPRNLSILADNASSTGVLAIAGGGTALTTFTANQIHYGSFSQSAGLTFDGTNLATTGTATATKLTIHWRHSSGYCRFKPERSNNGNGNGNKVDPYGNKRNR